MPQKVNSCKNSAAKFIAVFEDPDGFERLERKPIGNADGLTEVWGKRRDAGGLSLSTIEADGGLWTAETFGSWLEDAGYSPTQILEEKETAVKISKAIAVGDWAQYAVPKPPGPTTYATGKITDVSRTGTLRGGGETVQGSEDDPAVKLRVYARTERGFLRTDRLVVRPSSKLRMIDEPEGIVEKQIELSEKIRTALRRKVEEHNEKHGGTPSKRANLRMLEAAMRRGIGAYKTNPGSVRPTVTSAEQWGYGRVNGLLHALRTGRYKRTPFDRDLLPESHALSTKSEDDLYRTIEEAEERAEAIGCVGHHVHEVDGETLYMPCDEMADYERLTGLAHESGEDLTLVETDPFAELYDTPTAAEARAILLGISGYHSHEVLGRPKYMPGESMIDLLEALARKSEPHPVSKAEWSTAYVNDLPDSAFFFIGSGGEKDDDGKTVPRSLRKLPYRNHNGSIDLPHLRNVLARLSQADIPEADRRRIRREAREILEEQTKKDVAKARYDSIDFSPPKGVQEAAELGLALRREHGRGGTLIGVARARDLAGGKSISPDTIKRMVSFFARHEVDLDAPKNKDRSHPDYPGAGRIAWLLWGGDPGRRWALKISERMKREDLAKSATIGEEFEDLTDQDPAEGVTIPVRDAIKLAKSVVNYVPDGARFLIAKSGGVEIINPKPEQPTDDVRLRRLLKSFPDGYAAEILLDDQGRAWGLDCLMASGAYLGDLGYGIRKAVADTLGEILGIQTIETDLVRSGADMILTVREIADANPAGTIEIRNLEEPHGSFRFLELETERSNLWKFVGPKVSDSPEVLIVSGSPNRIESIRGVPLSGPDGFTFRKSYLPRFGLDLDAVSIVHACPMEGGEVSDWAEWLSDFVGDHPTVPIIALGKSASGSLGDVSHTVLPHPRAIRRRGDRGEIERKSKSIRKAIEAKKVNSCKNLQPQSEPGGSIYFPITKADDEARIVYGVVLEPHTTDLQGDVLSIDTIENAAHKYLIEHRTVGDNHSQKARAEVVESYLAPADMELGGQKISKGSWVMAVHVIDDELWKSVKSGDYSGFSIGGTGARTKIEEATI